MTGRGNERGELDGLTRISVRSSGDSYFVSHGGGPAVRVRRRGGELLCECGRANCAHIRSLALCGFVDSVHDMPMAA